MVFDESESTNLAERIAKAKAMREMDEPERDWAIENAGNVIDMRGHFEREQMSRHVTVVYLWDSEDDPA